MPGTSAGLLLYRGPAGKLEVFLVHPGGPFFVNKDNGDWSIPKGEIDEGEDFLACAIREVKEETGLSVDPGSAFIPLGTIQQKGGKIVHAWAARYEGEFRFDNSNSYVLMEYPYKSGKKIKFPEVDKAAFFPLSTAREKIKAAQAEFISRLEDHLAKADNRG